MKKYITLFIFIIVTSFAAFAYDGVYNGVMLIGSHERYFNVTTADGLSGTINYNVELYTDGANKQYCFRFGFKQSKHSFMIPTHATILMKTKKGEVIELSALYAYNDFSSDVIDIAYFPIAEDQLSRLMKDGVIKFRIQTMAENDHHSTYAEKEWTIQTFGPNLSEMVKEVNSKWDKKKKKFASSQKDIRSDF